MTVLIYLALLHEFARADKEVMPDGPMNPQQTIDFRFPGPRRTWRSKDELDCIRKKSNSADLLYSKAALQNYTKLAPYLDIGFDKYGFTAVERALFYSQVMQESGGFTSMTEDYTYSKPASDGMGQVIRAALSDDKFAGKVGGKRAEDLGPFRGRGLVRVTGCENFFSILHTMRLVNEGKPAVWRTGWSYPDGTKDGHAINEFCTEDEVRKMKAEYKRKYGVDVDPYNVLENPVRLAMLDGEFSDGAGNKMDSEKFVVEASLAYWRARCGGESTNSADRTKLQSYEPCRKYYDPRDTEYENHASRCMTKCVRRTTIDTWEKRARWLKLAIPCLKG